MRISSLRLSTILMSLILFCGCSSTSVGRYGDIPIVIDYERIKDADYSSDYVGKIADAMSKGYSNIKKVTGYSASNNEIIIRPKSLDVSRPPLASFGINHRTTANSEVEVQVNSINETISVYGVGEYKKSTFGDITGVLVGMATLSASLAVEGVTYRNITYTRAMESMASNLYDKVENSNSIQAALENVKVTGSAASNLTFISNFSDKKSIFSNNVLDAVEEADLVISITNGGKGISFATTLEISSDSPQITFSKSMTIGDIPPGETREVKVPLKAGVDLENGQATFQIQAKEKRGYDSKRLVMKIPTAALEKPDLVIASFQINDGNTGFAQGNGNGIPENGETIEIVPMVKNNGVGKAIRVKVAIVSVSSGIVIKEESAVIPEIAPGDTGSARLAFHIPTTYAGGPIKLDLSAVDVRGVQVAQVSKQFALNTEINRPILAYTWRLLDRNGKEKEFLYNGEEGEIEIRPLNKGQHEALNISVELESGSIYFSKARDNINRIAAQGDYSPIRFPYTVPRTLDKNIADVTVRLEQKDFSGLSDPRTIPIRVVNPEFRVTHQILSPSGSNGLKQGESPEIVVRVVNTGQLDAEDVSLAISITPRKGIVLKGSKEASLGRLEAGKSATARFSIDVQHSAEAGILPVIFSITQKNFGNKNEEVALAIVSDQDEVITVQGEQRAKPVVAATAASTATPPMIFMPIPKDNTRVAAESILLNGSVTAVNGVSSIQIKINGKNYDSGNRGIKMSDKENLGATERDVSEQIPLEPGRNEIIVTALDNKNLTKTKTITVFRENKKGNIYAAVIGLNRYQTPGINLKYAKNDAQAFASYMVENMGLEPGKNLFELYDDQATLRGIKSLLGKKLHEAANNPEDTVYIYFAGHGAPEQDASAKDMDKISKYLLSYDAEPSDLFGTAMPMDEIAKILSRLNADRVFFILDACYSGDVGGRTMVAKNMRSAQLSEDFLNRMAQGKGRIILTSSSPNETSQEDDALQHGYFTYYLIKGLKGGADTNGDGVIDIHALSHYLNKTVPTKTNGKQHPVLKGETEGQVVIGKVRKDQQ